MTKFDVYNPSNFGSQVVLVSSRPKGYAQIITEVWIDGVKINNTRSAQLVCDPAEPTRLLLELYVATIEIKPANPT